MIPDTPQTLLRRIAEYAQGDDAAEWAKFVELYDPVIRMYIAQTGNVSLVDTDDIVQDIFVRLVDVLRNGKFKKEKGLFRSYLVSMVRRLLIDRYRREMVRPDRGASMKPPTEGTQSIASADDIPSDWPDPAMIVDMRFAIARHQAAVEHVLCRTMLEKRTVAAYREYAIEEQPAAEVAARHGITINNLRQLKYRIDRMISALEASYDK